MCEDSVWMSVKIIVKIIVEVKPVTRIAVRMHNVLGEQGSVRRDAVYSRLSLGKPLVQKSLCLRMAIWPLETFAAGPWR